MSRKMKDSGIEWVGEIPESWDLRKGKFLFEQRNEKGNSKELQLLSPTQKYGVIPQNLYEKLSGMKPVKLDVETDYSQMKSIYTGDFCISLRSFQGGFEYSNYNGVVSPAYQVFYKRIDLCDSYYRYMFKDRGFIDKMSSYTKTFRDGKLISFNDFANSLIPIPPLNEQTAIAAYLDRQCTHIDNIIEKTKTSIEEYKKLKQAVITQAVTKGIRGDREMKNSGIEWIGEIPVEWGVSRVGLHFDVVLGKMLCSEPLSDDYTLESYYCAANVHFEGIDKQELKKMWFSSDEKKQYLVKTGDLLVVEGGAGAGGCAIVESITNNVYIQNSIMIVRAKKQLSCRYLRYVIEYLVKAGYVDLVCNKATIPHFTKEKLCNVPIIITDEQQEIAAYLDQKCTEIDAIITKKQQFIIEMESYKKSLIFECVTGKREVYDV